MIPERLLAQQLTLVRPSKHPSAYGDPQLDYGDTAQRVAFTGRVWPVGGHEVTDGRQAVISDWTLLTATPLLQMHPRDRVERDDLVFEIVGPVQVVHDGIGEQHHVTAPLRTVEG